MTDFVYSVRMRAAVGGSHESGGRHLSGGERLVDESQIDIAVVQLLQRARERGSGADFTQIVVERIPRANLQETPCLPVSMAPANTPDQSRAAATTILLEAGISPIAIDLAFAGLTGGFDSSGSPLRGAALLDQRNGDRLDPNPDRGIRASRFDYSPRADGDVTSALKAVGLSHFRTREALALATKVIWSGVTAELCWSDEPDYTPGYVATAKGYVRFAGFKPAGAVGGRVFFVDSSSKSVPAIVDRLERTALWITGGVEIVS